MANDTEGRYDNDIGKTEKAYTPVQAADMLDVAVTTIRKYCQRLEKHGYTFIKGQGTGGRLSRLFLEQDITALQHFIYLRKNGHVSVDAAAEVVISKFGKGATYDVSSSDTKQDISSTQDVSSSNTLEKYDTNNQYDKLFDLIDRQSQYTEKQNQRIEEQNQYLKELSEKMDEQQEMLKRQQNYIDNRINERDKLLMQTLNETQKANEEKKEEKNDSEEKKGFFRRLFNL